MKNQNNIFLRAQGRAAMLGFILLSASYLANDQIIPGIY